MADRDLRFFEQAAELQREGRPFALALVVSRRSPVSSHLGDRAVIFADGRMRGFVGGACAREIIRKQALQALALGSPRLVQIRPDGAANGMLPDAEHVVVPMSCASEGSVDVYIEPYPRPPLLLVAGYSPVADALARLGQDLDYDVARVVAAEERQDLEGTAAKVIILDDLAAYLAALPPERRALLTAVVASQGHYDEPALEALLRARPFYLGLLASRKRGAVVGALLRDRGFTEAEVAAIRSPAGLDLGARSAAEVAVSILAEIIGLTSRAELPAGEGLAVGAAPTAAVATDPVCGMEVEIAGARHTTELDGRRYYFCCPHCKARFEQNPAAYLVGSGPA